MNAAFAGLRSKDNPRRQGLARSGVMPRFSKIWFCATVGTVLALSGCGGGGGNAASGPALALSSYSVTGTDGNTSTVPTANGAAPSTVDLNAALNNGGFVMAFATNAGDAVYGAEVYVSTQPTLTLGANAAPPSTAQMLYATGCNDGTSSGCTSSLSTPCTYTNTSGDAQVTCQNDDSLSSTQKDHDLKTYFANNGGSSGSYYLILQVCGSQQCDQKALPVLFQ